MTVLKALNMSFVEQFLLNRIGIRETDGLNPVATALLVGKARMYVHANNTVFEGVELPEHGPALLVGNHYKEADNYKVTVACWRVGRIVRAVVRRSLVDRNSKESDAYLESIGEKTDPLEYNWFRAFVLRGSGTIPTSRGETDISTIRGINRALEIGLIPGIYLQPTRNENCGLEGLTRGVGYIALRHPDIPVYLCAFSGPPYGPDKMTIIHPSDFMLKRSRREIDDIEATIMMADMIAEKLPQEPQRNWWANREAEIARLRELQKVRS